MKNHGPLDPTCVLKVNLQCCKACPRLVKRQLKKVDGVTHIHIDTEEGLVTVSGVADASVLINAIKKAGRNAKLHKFEMHPKAKHMKGKHPHDDDHSDTCSCCDDDDGGDLHAPHFNGNGALGSNVTVPGYHHHPQIAMRGGSAGYFPGAVMPLYPHAIPHHRYQCAPPPMVGYGRPPPPPHPNNCYHYQRCPPQAQVLLPPSYHHREHNYGDTDGALDKSLVHYQRCPPQAQVLLPPSYHHREHNYGDTDGALDKSLVHTFSDLNVNACTIM